MEKKYEKIEYGKRVVKLKGEKVYLGPVIKEDIEKYTHWLNDIDVTKYLMQTGQVITIENEEEWFERIIKKKEEKLFAIIDKETMETIGNVGLHDIDPINRTANFGIFIGNKEYWGKGYGTEAGKLIIDFGFNILNLNNIWLQVYGYNKRAVRAYEKIGFKEVGRRRETLFFNGKYYDGIYMDILAREFEFATIDKQMEEKIE
ncbi:GNAT family N-acetyltransferase [Nanoarchaeota archaeon]